MEDREIIELYFARDEQAIAQTESKYGRICMSIAGNILLSREDSEECVNDTYLTAWNLIPPERPRRFPAYLAKIVRNLALKCLERSQAQKRSPELTISFEELSYILPDEKVAAQMEDQQLGWIISDFLRTEKEEARRVFLRKYWFFDSVSEIAQRYGYSENKVKSMLLRTRNRLKEYLRKEGFDV